MAAVATTSSTSSITFLCRTSNLPYVQVRPLAQFASRRRIPKYIAALMTDKPNTSTSTDSAIKIDEEATTNTNSTVNTDEEATTNTNSTVNTDEEDATSTSKLESLVIRAEKSFNVFATEFVIAILDQLYAKRDYSRFYVLETIARVPYFAFVSVLHMYESFGWWRRSDYLKVHFAESWNELHHLLVMEALGGDERWFDRFLAQHIAVVYYFLTSFMYIISPRMAYHFSECVERHAYTTYDKFIKAHGEELKKLPAPQVAIDYYTKGDLYMFDEFQTHRLPETRRPRVDNLYDVFVNIREDEWEHCKTMHACQIRGNLQSPHSTGPGYSKEEQEDDTCIAECAGIVECATTATSHSERVRRKTSVSPKLD